MLSTLLGSYRCQNSRLRTKGPPLWHSNGDRDADPTPSTLAQEVKGGPQVAMVTNAGGGRPHADETAAWAFAHSVQANDHIKA